MWDKKGLVQRRWDTWDIEGDGRGDIDLSWDIPNKQRRRGGLPGLIQRREGKLLGDLIADLMQLYNGKTGGGWLPALGKKLE
jgi:hypothetical protein